MQNDVNKRFDVTSLRASSRFPFYYELKIVFLLWLISPVSRGSLGSSLLYRKLVHPNLMKKEEVRLIITENAFDGIDMSGCLFRRSIA